MLGTVTLRRAYYHCRRCRSGTAPYDVNVGMGTEAMSPSLAKAVALLGVDRPFRQAHRLLYELAGQRVSAETIRRLTTRIGTRSVQQEEAAAALMQSCKPPAADATPQRLYVAVDGVMVRQNKGFKEAKTVVCYGDDAAGQPTRRVAVRFEAAGEFKAHAWSTACRHGLMQAQEKVLLGDGAAWIWDHVGGVLGNDVTHIVDWYHATEHVWDCGKVLHGEGTKKTTAWVASMKSKLSEGNVRDMTAQLKTEKAVLRSSAKRKALTGLITYLNNQDDRLAYARFRLRGLDIGSGQVESACKSVVAARLKGSGMRWSASGAQAVVSLRCTWLNNDWDAFWSARPLAA